MKKNVDHIREQAESIRGLLDQIERYAGEVNDSAAKHSTVAAEYKALCVKVIEKKAELVAAQQ
ncbi:MAG: hypothetical protein ACRCZI_12990, partial [Cetobacterium sp.]